MCSKKNLAQSERCARLFSDGTGDGYQCLGSSHTIEALNFVYNVSQILHFWKLQQNDDIKLPRNCICILDAFDFERSFCNIPYNIGLRVNEDICFQIASLNTCSFSENKKLARDR